MLLDYVPTVLDGLSRVSAGGSPRGCETDSASGRRTCLPKVRDARQCQRDDASDRLCPHRRDVAGRRGPIS